MKRQFMGLLFLAYSLNVGAVSHDVNENVRKFSVATLLVGLANTLASIGGVIGASSSHEKQQAALGIVGSLFSMAGTIVAQQEQEKAEKENRERQKEAQQQQEEVKGRFCGLVVDLFDAVDNDKVDNKRSPQLSVLGLVGRCATREESVNIVALLLSCPKTLRCVLDDTFVLVKQVITQECYKLKTFRAVAEESSFSEESESIQEIDKQAEKLDQGVITFAKELWFFLLEIVKKDDVFTYLQDQLYLLADYIKEKFMFFLGQDLLFVREDGEEVAVEQVVG